MKASFLASFFLIIFGNSSNDCISKSVILIHPFCLRKASVPVCSKIFPHYSPLTLITARPRMRREGEFAGTSTRKALSPSTMTPPAGER